MTKILIDYSLFDGERVALPVILRFDLGFLGEVGHQLIEGVHEPLMEPVSEGLRAS